MHSSDGMARDISAQMREEKEPRNYVSKCCEGPVQIHLAS